MLRVGEVYRELELPKSSVSRLLKTMSDEGMLQRHTDGLGYVLGPLALKFGDLYAAQHTLLELVDRAAQSLVEHFGFVSYIGVLDGEMLILRRKEGNYPLRLQRNVGSRVPAFRSAIGRAQLARMPARQALSIIKKDPLWAERLDQAKADLATIRRDGVVIMGHTETLGVGTVAAAVSDPSKGETLSFTLTFPLVAVNKAVFAEIVEKVWGKAAEIGIRYQDPFWAQREGKPPSLDLSSFLSEIPTTDEVPAAESLGMER